MARRQCRWACALTGGVAAGEDVAQVAFARIADRYEQLDNPGGYLRTTIVNLARSDRRSGARRTARELRVVGDRSAATDAAPFVGGSELLRLVGALPYDQRAAIVLRYWADWDEASIATALDCRPATVRSHINRGIDALRRAVGPTTNEISRHGDRVMDQHLDTDDALLQQLRAPTSTSSSATPGSSPRCSSPYGGRSPRSPDAGWCSAWQPHRSSRSWEASCSCNAAAT